MKKQLRLFLISLAVSAALWTLPYNLQAQIDDAKASTGKIGAYTASGATVETQTINSFAVAKRPQDTVTFWNGVFTP